MGAKIATTVLVGIILSELAWAFYTYTVLTIGQSLELMVLTAFAVVCGILGWGLEMEQ